MTLLSLHRINIKCSNNLSDSKQHSGWKMFSVMLKMCFTAADEAGKARYFKAIFANVDI